MAHSPVKGFKPGKAPGPDKCPNELLKAMSEEEFLS